MPQDLDKLKTRRGRLLEQARILHLCLPQPPCPRRPWGTAASRVLRLAFRHHAKSPDHCASSSRAQSTPAVDAVAAQCPPLQARLSSVHTMARGDAPCRGASAPKGVKSCSRAAGVRRSGRCWPRLATVRARNSSLTAGGCARAHEIHCCPHELSAREKGRPRLRGCGWTRCGEWPPE